METARVSLNADELWLLHAMLASGEASPSHVGMLLDPKTLPAGSPPWERVCAAVDRLSARGLIQAKPVHTFGIGTGAPTQFTGTKFTDKGLLSVAALESP